MATHTKLLLLCGLLFIISTAQANYYDNCRQYANCESCLNDPNCGWCATAAVCVPGISSGPTSGNCTTWDWLNCNANPTTTPNMSPSATRTPTPSKQGSTTPSPSPTKVPYHPPVANSNWLAFGGDNAHTGFANTFLGSISPTLRWSTNFPSTSLSYSVIYSGVLYTMTSKGELIAVDIATGVSSNYTVAEGSYVGPPTIGSGGLLYVQEIGSNEGINLYALSINNPLQQKWKGTGASQWATYPYGTASSASYGLVFMAGGEYNGVMYSVNATVGTSHWASSLYSTSFGCDYWAPSVYNDSRVFFGTQPGESNMGMIGEVNITTGKVLWKVPLISSWDGYSTYWVPVVSSGFALAMNRTGSNLGLALVNIDTQSLLWSYKCGRPVTIAAGTFLDYSPATDGDFVFLVCSEGLMMIDAADGSVFQEFGCNECNGQPIVTKDYVIANSKTGVVIISRVSGLQKFNLGVTGKLAFSGGWLYITSANTIYAYQLSI